MSRRATLLLLPALTACGARVEVADTSTGSSSAGAVAGAAGSAAGGSAGQGGSAGGDTGAGGAGRLTACNLLTFVSPALTIATEPKVAFDDSLHFTASSEDGKQVTAVFVRQLEGTKSNVVHYSTFQPYKKSWPQEGEIPFLSTPYEVEDGPFPALSAGGRFGFAALRPNGVQLISGLDPAASGAGFLPAIPIDGEDAEFAVRRAAGLDGPTHLIGSFDAMTDGILATVITEGKETNGSALLGCAAVQPPRAGAVAYEKGWIAAVSNGSPGGPGCVTPNPDYPKRIDVVRIGPDASVSLILSIPTETVVSLQVAPHPDGAYITWWQSPGAIGELRGARVDAKTGTLVGPVDLALQGEVPGQMVAGAVGHLLAVARRGDPAGVPTGIVLTVHDETLAMTAAAHYLPPEAFNGPSSVIGAPDGIGVLVGWTSPGQAPEPWRVRLARFDCGP